jgi:SAM-dependent methyltransferase
MRAAETGIPTSVSEEKMQGYHYRGLIAEWYDDWLKERTDDRDYYSGFFRGFGGRVLELACGTGRLLVPIAESGVRVDGLDSSEDMLAVLERKAAELGVENVGLHNQSMEEFALSAEYDAIFVASGSFQLLTSPESALNSLKCIRGHLAETGFFLVDIFVPWDDIIEQKCDNYRVTRDVTRADGKRSIVLERFEIDIPRQMKRGTYRYEFYDQKRLVECITDELAVRWYWKDEYLSFLRKAGFSSVEILAQSPLYREGYSFVFEASK